MSIHLLWHADVDVVDPYLMPELRVKQLGAILKLTEDFFIKRVPHECDELISCMTFRIATSDREKLYLFLCEHHECDPYSQDSAYVVELIQPNGKREITFSLDPDPTEHVHKDLYAKFKITPEAQHVG